MRSTDPHEIAGLLFAAAEATRSRFEELCARFEMTPVQARALLALERPLAMRDLAALLRCDQSNVTGLADRLERQGLVAREPDPADRRVTRLAATRKGQALRRKLDAALHETSPFLASLGDRELRALRDLLRKVVAAGPPTVSR